MKDYPLDLIEPDPNQVRRGGMGDLPGLASSIEQWGLLQNLVVRAEGDRLVIVAGERRWRAMQILRTEHRTPKDMGDDWYNHIPCMMIGTNGIFEQLAENGLREDVAVWHVGHRLLELQDMGYTQAMIGERLNKSQGYISTCCRIARYLSPMVIRSLDRLGPQALKNNQLLRIASLYDPVTFEIDEKAQVAALERMLTDRRPTTGPRQVVPIKERVWVRYMKLKRGIVVPSHAQSYVEAFIRYLDGRDPKLTFR